MTLFSGVAGGLFSRLLILSLSTLSRDLLSRLRQRRPVLFAAGCGLAVAAIGALTGGSTLGSGYTHTRDMLAGTESAPVLHVLFKFVVTWLTTWSGVPASIFAPSLAIGAGLGNEWLY